MKSVRQIDGICAAGAVALALACGISAFKLARYNQGRVEHHNNTVQQLHNDLQRARGHVVQLQLARGTAQTYLDALEDRSVSAADVGTFLDELEEIAVDAGVALSDLRQQPPVQTKNGIRMPLVVACRGAFEDVHGFLYALENAGPILHLETLNLTADRAAGECALSLKANIVQR